ncbi:MAG TPA: reverse transcriptase domain-containing protein [Candidatus Angelobacter sp.]|nr:reverse transcriptase domain-containing protein [Candidatus Angelobacter sp.]
MPPSLRLTATDAVLRQQFLDLKTRDDVAALLDVSSRELRFYLYKGKSYNVFSIPKRAGGTRLIYSPANALKIIQKKLNQVLHAVYKSRSPVHGFVRKRSIKSNAKRHLDAEWLLNFDLADFFPSIHFGRVRGLFSQKPYSLPVEAAQALAQICCYEKALPAGAPTSPMIANLVCAQLDAQIKGLAKQYGCIYTRYADDITISTRTPRLAPQIAFRDPVAKRWQIGDELKNIVASNLFSINEKKTHVRPKSSRQEVTGIRINEGLNVSRNLVRQVRAMLHAWETYGENAANTEFLAKYNKQRNPKRTPEFRAVLRGKLEFIGFVKGRDNDIYVRLLNRFLFLDDLLAAKPILITHKAGDEAIKQAVWLLMSENEEQQGTAFAVEGGFLLTAWHCVEREMWVSRPWLDNKKYKVTVTKKDEIRDIAQLSIPIRPPIQFQIGNDSLLQIGIPISLLGFPSYHDGDSVSFRQGNITQLRVYQKIPHYLIDADIVTGNSGGPILNGKNQIVGIAVKGLQTPGIFSQFDQLSSFVPISLRSYMKDIL